MSDSSTQLRNTWRLRKRKVSDSDGVRVLCLWKLLTTSPLIGRIGQLLS